jgi:uncharacterized protein (DUF362 family)
MKRMSRRDFLKTAAVGGAAIGLGSMASPLSVLKPTAASASVDKAVVSIVRIKNGNIDYAVRNAIDLLGGMKTITAGKERIMLKPNLVSPDPRDVTKPEIIKALTNLMTELGKDVCIGEGSAASYPNLRPANFGGVCRTTDKEMLNQIQQTVFDSLGYSELAKDLRVPLINLHTGDMAKVHLPNGFVFKEISLHQSLADTDLLCSVPMMKTHGLAAVTLGMKNLIGAYPGQVYGTVRSAVHAEASKVESSGTASAIIDMVRANKLGLVVIDGSVAMQGQGPSASQGGELVKMDLIIAGTNPLATDMVGAFVMGFRPDEISTFLWASKAGMTPTSMEGIEIKGEKLADVGRPFKKPMVVPWAFISQYGPPC